MGNITETSVFENSKKYSENHYWNFDEIDGINNLAIVWYYKDDEIHIHQIYNHDTGEVYWDYESMGNMDWTDNDDKLVGSILMYGNLESVIGIN